MKEEMKKQRVVLAYGEVTGHAHAFYEPEAVELSGNVLTIKKENAKLVHEEHAPFAFKPGQGEVVIQREYQRGSLKRVAD